MQVRVPRPGAGLLGRPVLLRRRLGLERQVRLELDAAPPGHREPPDRDAGVPGQRARGDLQRVRPRHRAVRADVEEVARAELRRPEVAHVVVDGVEVPVPVVVAEQLDPAVRAGVEVVVDEDALQRVEARQGRVGPPEFRGQGPLARGNAHRVGS